VGSLCHSPLSNTKDKFCYSYTKSQLTVQHNFCMNVLLHVRQIFYQLPHIPDTQKYNKLCNVCQVTLPRVCVDPLPHWYISFYFQIFKCCVHGYSSTVHTDTPLSSSIATLSYMSVFNPLLLPGAELPNWKFWPSQRPLSTSLDPGCRPSSFWSSFGRCPVYCYPPICTWVFLVIFCLEVSN